MILRSQPNNSISIMDVAIIATNYNNTSYSEKMVKSIHEADLTDISLKIVLVDNASPNLKERERFTQLRKYGDVICIQSSDNLGYFGGLNLGIEYIKHNFIIPVLVIIGNNDLIYSQCFFQTLRTQSISYRNHMVVSPNIITLDGRSQNPHVLDGISATRRLIYRLYYSNYYLGTIMMWLRRRLGRIVDRTNTGAKVGQPGVISSGHGACYILTQKFFEVFDYLPNYTFLLFEEAILAIEVAKHNGTIYYDPSLLVTHYHHASIGKMASKQLWDISSESYNTYENYRKGVPVTERAGPRF